MEVDYLAAEPTTASLALGAGVGTPIEFTAGPGRVVARVEGGGRTVTIDGVPQGVGICVARVAVGGWVPAPGFEVD